jgi:signal transduction histidine kinase
MKKSSFNPELRELMDGLLYLFGRATQIPVAMYQLDSEGRISGVISKDERLAIPTAIDDASGHFHRITFTPPVIQTGESECVIHYGDSPNSDIENGTELAVIREILSRVLKGVAYEYSHYRERDKRIQRAAYHDVQIRLQAALAYAENLQHNFVPSASEHASLESLMGAVSSAATVMHNLSHGAFLPEKYIFTRCDIADLIRRTAAFFRAEAASKNIRIEIDFRPNHFVIQASELHLEQAISNLLQNAVKYSYRGSSDFSERFISAQGRIIGGECEVSISNYGVGIEADECDRIFLEGYKGRLTQQEYRTGSGQGLSLTKRVIDGHRGRIEVSSRRMSDQVSDGSPPYLTRFTVRLPLKQPLD